MKFFKSALRMWITLTSMAGFLGGWVLLAHSPKPQPVVNTNTTTTDPNANPTTSTTSATSNLNLPPVPSLDSLLSQNGQQQQTNIFQSLAPSNPPPAVSVAPSTNNFMPRFRTSGS